MGQEAFKVSWSDYGASGEISVTGLIAPQLLSIMVSAIVFSLSGYYLRNRMLKAAKG